MCIALSLLKTATNDWKIYYLLVKVDIVLLYMCKMFLLFSAAGLEVRVSTNPMSMREGISSSPHSSHLVLPLSLSGEMESAAY